MKSVFIGSCVALVTPFKDGKVDYLSLKKMLNYQIECKTDAVVLLGTTGEAPTILPDERREIIKFSKKIVDGKLKLIVGSGSNSTKLCIDKCVEAEKLGADALLVVTPYYNKCTQEGLISHYKLVAESVKIPIILYNVPSRTGVNILPETAERLSEISNICGIKEASGNIDQIMKLTKLLKNKMAVYSGDDALNYLFLNLGASGVISVTANIFPKEMKNLVDYAMNFQTKKALILHENLLEINKLMFCEVNPIPVKFACYVKNLCENELRLPLTKLSKNFEERIKDIVLNLK